MHNELFMKQETFIDYQTKLSVNTLTKMRYVTSTEIVKFGFQIIYTSKH